MNDSLDEVAALDIFCTKPIQKGPVMKIPVNRTYCKNYVVFVS